MADPSLTPNFTITREEGMILEEPRLRRRAPAPEIQPNKEVYTKYREVICKLPAVEVWPTMVCRQFRGFWQRELVLPGVFAIQEVFKPHPGDVIVASYPKSGTTWLKALVFTIVHRNKYAFSSHPLLKLNPHDCVPSMEEQYAMGDEQYLENLSSPRVLGTHMPYSVLPESVRMSKCRIIYICREPKDVIVSYWHFVTRMNGLNDQPSSFTGLFKLFCDGRMQCSPFWDHVLEYYTKSLHSPEKILFLKYEEMKKNPLAGVMRIADFIGCPLSDEEVKKGLVEEIVEFFFSELTGNVQNNQFFRKAVVGDWQNHLTAEMATKLDEITKEKLHGCGLTFGVLQG